MVQGVSICGLVKQLCSQAARNWRCIRYEAVRVKQQQFPPNSAEPREIAQIKELAQEMTSLREELWQLKSAGTPASVSAAASAAVAASNSRNGRRRGR